MFYETLQKLCDEKGASVTATVTSLGISKSNITNWKAGIMPGAETLSKLAKHFDVSVDYLLGHEKVKKISAPILSVPVAMMNTPARVFSLSSGNEISEYARWLMSSYLGCLSLYNSTYNYAPDVQRSVNPKGFIEIVEVLDCPAANSEYKAVQMQISCIVWLNLKAKGIDLSSKSEKNGKNLGEEFGLAPAVINDIKEKIENPDKKINNGFNISDIYKIRRKLAERGVNISIEYMFTGIDNPTYTNEPHV
jgi:transcriptional regulator with XRE-family HTH domain